MTHATIDFPKYMYAPGIKRAHVGANIKSHSRIRSRSRHPMEWDLVAHVYFASCPLPAEDVLTNDSKGARFPRSRGSCDMYLPRKIHQSTNPRNLLEYISRRVTNGHQMLDDDHVFFLLAQATATTSHFRDGPTDLQGTSPETQAFKSFSCLRYSRVSPGEASGDPRYCSKSYQGESFCLGAAILSGPISSENLVTCRVFRKESLTGVAC